MKAKVSIEEIYKHLKKLFGSSEFTRNAGVEAIRKLYYEKTGEPCSTPIAYDKIRFLVEIGLIETKDGFLFKISDKDGRVEKSG